MSDEDLIAHRPYLAPFLDVVLLPVAPLGIGREGDIGTPYEGLSFSKIGLAVRANSTVRLEANASGRVDVVMQWVLEDPDHPSNVLIVGPCDAGGAGWLVFAGGFWVSEAACLTVVATKVGSHLLGTSPLEESAGVVVSVGEVACTPDN
jgi:hypothetical protein